jgi:hypothetical protein
MAMLCLTDITLPPASGKGITIIGTGTLAERVGWSVSGAGYVNNDDFADFIIGAPYANTETGESYLIFG